jgi:hypothetical protein
MYSAWPVPRLLVLASGAVRLGFPKAVVFTSAAPGQPNCFLGWATPGELQRRLLARSPVLAEAHRAAQRDWLLWQLGAPQQPGSQRVLPWAPHGKMRTCLPADAALPQLAERNASGTVELPWPSPAPQPTPWVMREDGFEAERLLLAYLSPIEGDGTAWSMTEARVRHLFGSVLHTEAVDHEDGEVTWVETVLGTTADFFAVTKGRQFVNLVPRRTAVNSVLLALVSDNGPTSGRRAGG